MNFYKKPYLDNKHPNIKYILLIATREIQNVSGFLLKYSGYIIPNGSVDYEAISR